MSLTAFGLKLLDQGRLPTPLLRIGVRRLLAARLNEEYAQDLEASHERFRAFLDSTKQAPLALHTQAANEQHYEVPTSFFQLCLGPNLKYSSGYWPAGVNRLGDAEAAMLDLTCKRAELADGQTILELGCGWGSLTLWMAERFRNSKILAVSNSNSQREHILGEAKKRGLGNVRVMTQDMRTLDLQETFDRVVSVEMFEHMRNYQELTQRVSRWMTPDAKLFVHIFTHRDVAYPFDVRSADDWMSRYFFTGGMMPSDHMLLYFQDQLRIVDHWRVDGRHYGKTARAWLDNLDDKKMAALPILEGTYGPGQGIKWFHRWRAFFVSCEELWNYAGGREWFVSHYLFERRP